MDLLRDVAIPPGRLFNTYRLKLFATDSRQSATCQLAFPSPFLQGRIREFLVIEGKLTV